MMAAAQSYDAMNLLLRAMFESSKDLSGPGAEEVAGESAAPLTGVVTTYDKPFSNADHDAISANMLWLGLAQR